MAFAVKQMLIIEGHLANFNECRLVYLWMLGRCCSLSDTYPASFIVIDITANHCLCMPLFSQGRSFAIRVGEACKNFLHEPGGCHHLPCLHWPVITLTAMTLSPGQL